MTLQTIWFILWGVLWIIYFILDGFDLGLGAAMPFLARNENRKRKLYNAMGPFWDGNEVWLLTAGGVTFAAFPETYATMFSAMYSALMLLLLALILRGVAFEFRGKSDNLTWKKTWDICLVAGSFLPALLLGVAFANIFKGVPVDAAGVFHGTLLTYLNPYGLAGGVLFVLMFLVHGALWMASKADDELGDDSIAFAGRVWVLLLGWAVIFLVMTWFATGLYDNYLESPVLFVIPLAAVVCLLLTRVFITRKEALKAWFASAGTILTVTAFGLAGLFPAMFPSSLDPAFSRTAFNASSSPLTLSIMLGVVLVFVPIVIGYQIWTYRFFSKGGDEAY